MNDGMISGILKIGAPTGAAMLASTKVVLEEGRISVAVAVTSTVFICGCVWWLSSKFTKIDDRLSDIEKRLNKLPCDRKGCIDD